MAVRNNSRTKAVLLSLDMTEKPEMLPQTVQPQTEQLMMQHGTVQTDEAWAARYMEQTELFEDLVSRNYLNISPPSGTHRHFHQMVYNKQDCTGEKHFLPRQTFDALHVAAQCGKEYHPCRE